MSAGFRLKVVAWIYTAAAVFLAYHDVRDLALVFLGGSILTFALGDLANALTQSAA